MTKKYVKAAGVKAGSRIPNPRRASLPKLGWAGSVNNSAAGQYMAGNADALSAAGSTAAGYLTAADQMDGKTNLLASAGSGALQGAATGLMFGPVGAVIGGAIGLAGGAIMGKLKQNAEEDAREAAEKAKRQREESIRNQREAASIAANSALMANYPTSGVANAGFAMAYGGTVGNPTFSEQAIKAQGLRPFSRSNADGSESTVLMASGSADGKYYAFPTLFPAAGNSGSRDPKNWIQPKDPFAEAQKRGELFSFDTEEDAKRFAEGAWKKSSEDEPSPRGVFPAASSGPRNSSSTYVKPVVGVPSESKTVKALRAAEGAKNAKTTNKDVGIIERIAGNPLDAAQIGLGSIAIGADFVPVVGTAISAGADGVNGLISGARSYHYAKRGDSSKAAFYGTMAALDAAAMVPGTGDISGASKIASLLARASRSRVLHAAHPLSKGATAYKASNFGVGMQAYGGKIPDSNAAYLAEDQEVIQHAPNDRPDTDRNGGIKKLNSNTSKFVGDTHEDPSQGIGGVNNSQARMYSNRLYVPQNLKDQLKKL